MIRNCRIYGQSIVTGNVGTGSVLLTLEEAAIAVADLSKKYKNLMKYWFEFEDVVVEGKDEQ